MNRHISKLMEIASKTGDWESCLTGFGGQEQRILRALGQNPMTVHQVGVRVNLAPNSCGTHLHNLSKKGVLLFRSQAPKIPGIYRVADPTFGQFLATIPLPLLSEAEAIDQTKGLVDKAIAPMLELLQEQGLIEDSDCVKDLILGSVMVVLQKEMLASK